MQVKPAKSVTEKQMRLIDRRWIERGRDLSQGFVDLDPRPGLCGKAGSGSAMLERWQAETMYDQPYNNLKAVAAFGEKQDDQIKPKNGMDRVQDTQITSRL